METVFRGYPQALWAERHLEPQGRMESRGGMEPQGAMESQGRFEPQGHAAVKEPYMLYRREEKGTEAPAGGKSAEDEYFRGLYPLGIRRLQSLVEEGCDRIDRPGSPIYDEYPDRVTLYRLRDGILEAAGARKLQADSDLTVLLLILEIRRRRERRNME